MEVFREQPNHIVYNDFLITLGGTEDTLRIEARHNNEVVIFEYSPDHIVFDRQLLPTEHQPGRPTRITDVPRNRNTGFEQEQFELEVTPEENTVSIQGRIEKPPVFTRAKKGQGKIPTSFIVAEVAASEEVLHEMQVPAKLIQATKHLKLAKGDMVEVSGLQNVYALQLQNGEEKEHTRIRVRSITLLGRGEKKL